MALRLVASLPLVVALGSSVLMGTSLAADASTFSGLLSKPVAEPSASPVASAERATPVTITKVLTFVVENHSLAQMRTSMPYVRQLATTYAYARNYTAIRHPSLPNYLAIASGSTHGVTDDRAPSAHRLRGPTIFDQAITLGKSAKIYGDAMTTNCQLKSDYPYAVKHNPWAYFIDGRSNCRKFDVPLADLTGDIDAGTMPNVGMLIPDLVHDAHDAQLRTSDAWIKKLVQQIQTGSDWESGHLAIVITSDEDDGESGNRVLTVVASRYQDQRVVRTALTHYSLTRLYESVIGARYLGGAATAPSMREAFGIKTPTSSRLR